MNVINGFGKHLEISLSLCFGDLVVADDFVEADVQVLVNKVCEPAFDKHVVQLQHVGVIGSPQRIDLADGINVDPYFFVFFVWLGPFEGKRVQLLCVLL